MENKNYKDEQFDSFLTKLLYYLQKDISKKKLILIERSK